MFRMNVSRLAFKYGLLSSIVLWSAFSGASADVREDAVYKEAIAKFEQDDLEGAHRLFKRLQENYPDDPTVLNNLAVIAARLNQHELALRLLEHAILSHPTISVNYKNLQSLYNYRTAQEYKKALSLESLELTTPELDFIGISVHTDDPAGKTAAELVLSQEAIEKPLVEETRPVAAESDKAQIEASLKQWAEAWSRQDLNAYFNSYVEDYRPRSGSCPFTLA